jgi:hypothetical protein
MTEELPGQPDSAEPIDDSPYEPFPKFHPFVKWFAIAMVIQFAAWLLMFVVPPLRPVYYSFYFPFIFIFPGPHYPRYGLAFFLLYLPILGSLTYSILAGIVATRIRNRKAGKNQSA